MFRKLEAWRTRLSVAALSLTAFGWLWLGLPRK
jgi:hypothetical protein